MKTNITGIKVLSTFGAPQLEEEVNNYLKKRMSISIVKRDMCFHDPHRSCLQISFCYNNKDVERHGTPEQVKIFNNFPGGTSSLKNIEKDVQNFISSKKEVVDVLFVNYTDKHVTLQAIAVFYLDY